MDEFVIIKGYENYKINNTGKVIRGEKEIKSFTLPNGYSKINLYSDREAKQLSIHRLVAIAFLGEPPTNKYIVNHKNSIRHDNRVENLEWMTYSENVKNGYKYGLVDKEANKKQLKSVRHLANAARRRKVILMHPNGEKFEFGSIREAAKSVGIFDSALGDTARGTRTKYKGYSVEFI